MFGFTAKKMLLNEITNALISHRNEFRERMRAQAAALLDDKSQGMDAAFQAINDSLFDAVGRDVAEFVKKTSPQAAQRLSAPTAEAELAGDGCVSETRDCESIYSRCYRALCGRAAPARDRMAVRQLQNLAIQDIMRQLSQDNE